jgi:hypothetical protein
MEFSPLGPSLSAVALQEIDNGVVALLFELYVEAVPRSWYYY